MEDILSMGTSFSNWGSENLHVCFKDIIAFSDSFICSVIMMSVLNINGFSLFPVQEDMV